MPDIFDCIRIAKSGPPPPVPGIDLYQREHIGNRYVTPSQDRVVEFVNARVRSTGKRPTIEEVRRHMGWKNRQSAADALRRVAGRLRREKREAPAISA